MMSPTSDHLDPLVNKRVVCRFARQALKFDLSQSLFSSFDVDKGSRLLLKTIAQEVALPAVTSVLDVGCGVGVLGLCLKKKQPALKLTVQDRDALALAFTKRNARLNHIADVAVAGGLGLQGLGDTRFDLIVANLPGKAGQPVLADMIGRMANHLSEAGRAAVVVVNPLAESIAEAIQKNGFALLFRERGREHTVFHFRGESMAVPVEPLDAYIRGEGDFEEAGLTYSLKTAYNLPEFDTLGFHTELALNSLKGQRGFGRLLVWNPGQGHVPVYLQHRWVSDISHITLAGRDLLSLIISKQNLLEHGLTTERLAMIHVPTILGVSGRYDFVAFFPGSDMRLFGRRPLAHIRAQLLAPDGNLLLVAKSTFVGRLIPSLEGFTKVSDKRRRGFRTLWLRLK